MAFSVSPSVIVREVDASQAVPAISTPPAALAGVFRWGPTNEPLLLSSENQLVDRFGAPNDDNYETFFTAADYLSYSNALYVVRADDGSTEANSTILDITLDANNDVVSDDSYYGAFKAIYKGELGNSLQVAWVSSTGFESEFVAVAGIPTNKVSNTQIDQVISFNASNVQFETANTQNLQDLIAGDVLEIGNESIGYQELRVSSFTETAVNVEATPGDANTSFLALYSYDIEFFNKYTLAETDLAKLSIKKKWQHGATFSRKPDANHIHVAVIDAGGEISGTKGFMLEKFENISTTEGAVSAQGTTNYYGTVIENFSSWVAIANSAPIGTASSAIASTKQWLVQHHRLLKQLLRWLN